MKWMKSTGSQVFMWDGWEAPLSTSLLPQGANSISDSHWSETTLNYWMMVERYPNLKEEVGGSIPGCETSSLLDRNLALACRPSVSKKQKQKQTFSQPAIWSLCKYTTTSALPVTLHTERASHPASHQRTPLNLHSAKLHRKTCMDAS